MFTFGVVSVIRNLGVSHGGATATTTGPVTNNYNNYSARKRETAILWFPPKKLLTNGERLTSKIALMPGIDTGVTLRVWREVVYAYRE